MFRGREACLEIGRERKRETGSVLSGDQTHNPGVCLDQEWNRQPLGAQDNPQPTEPSQAAQHMLCVLCRLPGGGAREGGDKFPLTTRIASMSCPLNISICFNTSAWGEFPCRHFTNKWVFVKRNRKKNPCRHEQQGHCKVNLVSASCPKPSRGQLGSARGWAQRWPISRPRVRSARSVGFRRNTAPVVRAVSGLSGEKELSRGKTQEKSRLLWKFPALGCLWCGQCLVNRIE